MDEGKQIFLEKNFLVDAPYLIVVAVETNKFYWIESTSLSVAWVILAAENEGFVILTFTPLVVITLYLIT